MIGADFPKFAEAHFASWGWRRLCAGFAIVALSVVLVDVFLPDPAWKSRVGVQRQEGKVHENVLLRWRDRRDPRGFTTPEETKLDATHFGLAWLSGSTISIRSDGTENNFKGRSSYELTDVFAAEVASIDGQELWIHEYMIQGARTGDMRRAILHAAEDPLIDAIVVALNPVWLFHDWAVYTESNQRASIVAMQGASWSDWTTAIRYTRPSSIVGAIAAGRFEFVQDRYANSRRMPRAVTLGFPLTEKPATSGLRYVNARTLYPASIFQAPPSMKKYEQHRSQLLRQTIDRDGEAARFFKQTLKTLARSEKPVLLYVAPLPSGIVEDPEVMAFLDGWLKKVDTFVAAYGGDNIVVHTDSVYGVQGEIIHRDIAHLHYGQGVVDEIKNLLQQSMSFHLELRETEALYGDQIDKVSAEN